MDIFEITIQHRLETGWPVVAERTRPSQLPLRSEGRLELDEEYESDLLSKQLDARDYGETLGLALFQGTLRDSYMAARAEAEAAQQPLRVLLVVEDPELKPLRWERLCAPDGSGGWDFLALDQRTLYSLYLPSLTDRRFPAIGRRDLRALVVLADPPADNKYGLASFDAGATAISIAAALGEIPHDLLGPAPGAVGPATLDALCDRITAGHYTMLHLVAHGQYRKDGETVLFLLDAPDQTAADKPPRVAAVPATELIKRLGRLRGARGLPHLAFLATCESAKPEAEAALGGLAQRLVRDLGMPAVVAMTERVSIATAERLTQPFYTRLRQHGQVDRALVEAGAGLQDRDDILVPALYSRLAGRPLFSDELEEGRRLTDEEIRYGLERLAELLPERASVLEDEFAVSAEALRGLLGSDEQALSKEARKERAQALDDLDALSEEVLDLTFQAVALDQPVPDYQANHCPFPGLRAFQTDDEAYFFGRDEAVEALLKRLDADRFLAVLGISGSGKSSLVLAGMVPKLIEQAKQAGQTLDYRALTPGSDPETALAKQLQLALPIGQPALLVIDQFEELFTLSIDPEARGRFLENLLKIGKDNPDLHTILTLRADFWGDCAPFEAFRQQMQAHQELLAPMTLAELRSAMEQQAASVGLRFEADLSHTILGEVKGEPGAMPLLQHLLRELWKRRHGRWLRASEYRNLGGIKHAIAHTADEIYDKLVKQDSGGEELMRNLFVRLTRLDDKSEGDEQHRDTRQRVPFDDLVPTGADSDRVRHLVQRLADARLLVITTDQETRQFEVEVSHEALIRHWPRLRTWLDKDRESWMLLAAVRQQAKDWAKRGKKDGDLPRWGERLVQAEGLFKQDRFAQNELERDFLYAAKHLWESEKRKKKIWTIGGILATAFFVVVIIYYWSDAEKSKQVALDNEKTAIENEETAIKERKRADDEKARAEEKAREADYQLAVSNWNSAVNEQETNSLIAAHYFARAARLFQDVERSENARIAVDALLPVMRLQSQFDNKKRVVPYPEEGLYLTSDSDMDADPVVQGWDAGSGLERKPAVLVGNDVVYSDGSIISAWDSAHGLRRRGASNGTEISPDLQLENGLNAHSPDGKRVLNESGISLNEAGLSQQLVIADGQGDKVLVSQETVSATNRISCVSDTETKRFTIDGRLQFTWSELWSELEDEDPNLIGSKAVVIESQDCTPRFELERLPFIRDAVFSGDGRYIAILTDEGVLRLHDSESGTLVESTLPARFVALDGSLALQRTTGNLLQRVWDEYGVYSHWREWVFSAQKNGRLPTDEKPVGVRFDTAGNRILTWSKSGIINVWDTTEKVARVHLESNLTGIVDAGINADGTRFVVLDSNRYLHLWSGSTGAEISNPSGERSAVDMFKFSPDGKWLLINYKDGTLQLLDNGKDSEPKMLEKLPTDQRLHNFRFSVDGSHIVTWSETKVTVWRTQSASRVGSDIVIPEGIKQADIGRAGKVLMIEGDIEVNDDGIMNAILLYDYADRTLPPARTIIAHWGLTGAELDTDGETILVNFGLEEAGSTFHLYQATDGKNLWSPELQNPGELIRFPAQYGYAKFTPYGNRVLTQSTYGNAGSGYGEVLGIWDRKSGKLAAREIRPSEPSGGEDPGLQTRFSNDGTKILGWVNHRIYLWDLASGAALMPPLEYQAPIKDATFTNGDREIAIWAEDSEVRFFSLYRSLRLPLDKLELQVQVMTGTRLNESGKVEWVSPQQWWALKRSFDAIEGQLHK